MIGSNPSMNGCILRMAFLLSVALGVTRTSAFDLLPGEVVHVGIDEVPYVETLNSPGHGSISSLFIDVNPATLDPGDSVQVSLWPSLGGSIPLLTVEANVTQMHETYGDSWRFRQSRWGEQFHSGVLQIKMVAGSVEINAVTFENFLSDFDYPRGANPGGLDDYNIYRISVTQVPEPSASVLTLGIVAILVCARALRR